MPDLDLLCTIWRRSGRTAGRASLEFAAGRLKAAAGRLMAAAGRPETPGMGAKYPGKARAWSQTALFNMATCKRGA